MKTYDKIYINGEWVPAVGTGAIEVVSPYSQEVVGSVPKGNEEDVNKAVAAAKAAFPAWAATSVEERAVYIEKLGEALAAREADIGSTISEEMGMPVTMARMVQAGLAINITKTYPDILRNFKFDEELGTTTVAKEPIGVCSFITPWNYPLYLIIAKVMPALAAGCTMVLKPSSDTPLNAYIFAEIVEEVGLPAGVFNMLTGSGSVCGEALSGHPDVEMVSITGSTEAGARVGENAAKTIKRVHQELGGKSANIILDDVEDFAAAVSAGVQGVMMNCGQTCAALTRMLVPESRKEEAYAVAAAVCNGVPLGNPSEEGMHLGPVSSKKQQKVVLDYINKGIAEGAKLLAGGPDFPEGVSEKGAFVKPTAFGDVTNDMVIAQEEIFGPVICILPYKTEAEAIDIANDSEYGLSGAVWSGDVDHAVDVARQIRTGQVAINGGGFNPFAPFGGYKKSGNGRELGEFGMVDYLEIKAINKPGAPSPMKAAAE
ncbi:MAG: aldehyde dehydrogenase family protein [Pseudomonadales bacterium]|nr:aldehyde dehydrogenase family protein [Pseudomonadales bacterium]